MRLIRFLPLVLLGLQACKPPQLAPPVMMPPTPHEQIAMHYKENITAGRSPHSSQLSLTLAKRAESMLGRREIVARDQHFHFDSVGLVRALLYEQGIDLFDVPAAQNLAKRGIDLAYQFAALHGELHTSRIPRVGDLVFFGETRDLTHDGVGDTLSHLGIVTEIADNATLKVVTTTMAGVEALYLNRVFPKDSASENGKRFNSQWITTLSRNQPQLASQAFYTFATLDETRIEFRSPRVIELR